MKRAHRVVLGFIILAILLAVASCASRNAGAKPVVRVHSGKAEGVETLSYTLKVKLEDSVNGMLGSTPGMRVAYRFKNDNVITRLDLPAEYFPDGQARILLTDRNRRRVAVFFERSLEPDAVFSQLDDQDALFQTPFDVSLGSSDRPYARKSIDDFVSQMRSAAFRVVQQNNYQVVVERVIHQQGGTRRLTLYFDAQQGAVTRVEDEVSVPDLHAVSTSDINYTTVQLEGGEEAVIPYEINTRLEATTQGEAEMPLVELPTADVEVPEGSEVSVAEDEYVAQSFTSIPGEGTVDPNIQNRSVSVRAEDIEINSADEDYFLLGRW